MTSARDQHGRFAAAMRLAERREEREALIDRAVRSYWAKDGRGARYEVWAGCKFVLNARGLRGIRAEFARLRGERW